MLFITFALFTVYGVVSGSPDICAKESPDVCFDPPMEPFDFPDSIEALDKICPIVITRLSCLVDYRNQCGYEFPGTIDDNLDQFQEFFTEACDKDSELHQELSIRLPCLEGIVINLRNTCVPIVEEAMDAVKSRILGSGDSENMESPGDRRKYYCLSEALSIACFMADASVTCGSATKQLIERLVDRLGFLDAVCQADILEEVKEMVSIMQVEMEEGLSFKNIVSKA